MEYQGDGPSALDLPWRGRQEYNTESDSKILPSAQLINTLTLISLEIQVQFPKISYPRSSYLC